MIKEYYNGYEIITIRDLTEEEKSKLAEIEIVESPWITIHDGINGLYYQYNRETGERRDVPEDWWK